MAAAAAPSVPAQRAVQAGGTIGRLCSDLWQRRTRDPRLTKHFSRSYSTRWTRLDASGRRSKGPPRALHTHSHTNPPPAKALSPLKAARAHWRSTSQTSGGTARWKACAPSSRTSLLLHAHAQTRRRTSQRSPSCRPRRVPWPRPSPRCCSPCRSGGSRSRCRRVRCCGAGPWWCARRLRARPTRRSDRRSQDLTTRARYLPAARRPDRGRALWRVAAWTRTACCA
mmetsp:Transcript_40017/g.94337  ORF Transcript_40017/g.94337 Transcript_40017/m.94337 type:complete len:226 (-) Transcript_40017:1433-2110(-)